MPLGRILCHQLLQHLGTVFRTMIQWEEIHGSLPIVLEKCDASLRSLRSVHDHCVGRPTESTEDCNLELLLCGLIQIAHSPVYTGKPFLHIVHKLHYFLFTANCVLVGLHPLLLCHASASLLPNLVSLALNLFQLFNHRLQPLIVLLDDGFKMLLARLHIHFPVSDLMKLGFSLFNCPLEIASCRSLCQAPLMHITELRLLISHLPLHFACQQTNFVLDLIVLFLISGTKIQLVVLLGVSTFLDLLLQSFQISSGLCAGLLKVVDFFLQALDVTLVFRQRAIRVVLCILCFLQPRLLLAVNGTQTFCSLLQLVPVIGSFCQGLSCLVQLILGCFGFLVDVPAFLLRLHKLLHLPLH
mmetsp:Transcript_29640/g.71198  ORF Transcript_29640/g.71198 Transcript_29640/m.71198 type:complete len:356 (-) Transcript_29640:784-1851(-)